MKPIVEVHSNATNLTNLDIIRLRGISSVADRYDELVRLMDVDRSELQAGTIVEAYMRYYEGGLNSGKLEAMGEMLERLVEGELLNEENTDMDY
jgi:beta-lactamase class A